MPASMQIREFRQTDILQGNHRGLPGHTPSCCMPAALPSQSSLQRLCMRRRHQQNPKLQRGVLCLPMSGSAFLLVIMLTGSAWLQGQPWPNHEDRVCNLPGRRYCNRHGSNMVLCCSACNYCAKVACRRANLSISVAMLQHTSLMRTGHLSVASLRSCMSPAPSAAILIVPKAM